MGFVLFLFVFSLGMAAMMFSGAKSFGSRKIGRNYFVGVRFPSTLASEEGWLAAQEAFAPWLRRAGNALVGTAFCALAVGVAVENSPVVAASFVSLAGATLMLVLVCWGAARANAVANTI